VNNIYVLVLGRVDTIQALVELNPSVYNRNFPMKIVLKCHPTLCDAIANVDDHENDIGDGHDGSSPGYGHGGGIQNLQVVASTSPDGPLVTSAPCTTSGRVPSSQPFCTDYSASFRAANGVWNLVWLSPGDARVSLPK
jgi:hypothetical protein